MKLSKLKFLTLILTLLLLFFFTANRKTKIEIQIDEEKISVWEGRNQLLSLNKKENQISLATIKLTIEHDQDSLWVLPLRRQKIEFIDNQTSQQTIFLEKPKAATILAQLKSQLVFNRPPFAAKVFYQDKGLLTKETITIKPKQLKKIILTTWNAAEVNLTIITSPNENLVLWSRPKFHHDGTLTIQNKSIPFIKPTGGSPTYYLKILSNLLTKNLLGTCVFLSLIMILIKILPNWKYKLLTFSPQSKKMIPFTLCFAVFAVSSLISIFILEKIPHSQDEVAYLFQAKIFSRGLLFAKSLPRELSRFFDQEFIINDKKWFSSFPPGTSFFLALGELAKITPLINPLISTISLFFLYLLAKKLISNKWAIWTSLLLATSPFFLLTSASYLSHPTALFFTLLAILSFIEIRQKPKTRLFWLIIGLALGFLSLVRPANAVLWSAILLLPLLKTALKNYRFALYGGLTLIFFLFVNLFYNFTLTENPLLLPYSLYSPYNKLGFGLRGLEWGGRFALREAFKNLTFNFYSLLDMLFRWPTFLTLSSVPLAFLGKFKKVSLWLLGLFLAQAGLYFFYFNEGAFLGPRFWFEIAWIIPLLTMIGIATLPEIFSHHRKKAILAAQFILIGLITYGVWSTLVILPTFKNFNGISSVTTPLLKAPAIVFVPGQESWHDYARFFIKQTPFLDNPIIFARDRAVHNLPKNQPPLANELLKQVFPGRHFYLFKDGFYSPL